MKTPYSKKTARFQFVVQLWNALDSVLAGRAVRRVLTSLAALGLAGLASLQAQTFTPIPLTPASFTVNTVIPLDWTYRLNAQSVSVTIDHGPALQTDTVAGFPTYYSVLSGNTFFERGMNRPNPTYGLPAGGTLLTNVSFASHVYQLPFWSNWNSNCVCICPYTNVINNVVQTYNSQPLVGGPYTYPTNSPYYNPSLTLNNTNGAGGFNTNKYTALSFLCSGGGPDSNTVTIQYADGTVQGPVPFAVPNWFVNAATYTYPGTPQSTPTCSYAYTAAARGNPAENQNTYANNTGVTSGSRLWSFDIALSNTSAPATNLIFTAGFTQAANGTTHADVIISVSGSANAADNATIPNTLVLTGPFTPIPVSGFNAGFVVANSPQTLAGLSPLNAVMDNGTNLAAGGNTWFEVGWDAAAPTNGFPAHGTVLTSAANPARTYQMPASYHQNSSTLIDTNHQLANITPQTPGTYTAFSLLTCGASIGSGNKMTNYIILQHSDGINETNVFYCYDWFETTVPYAYASYERVNIGNSSGTAGRSVQNLDTTGTSAGVPRIFESEFQMLDGSPVTNIQVGYTTIQGHANWASYIIAVSASTNFLPVSQVINYAPAQNVYAGQSASFNVVPGIGSLPAFQWQYTDGATFTNNLPNGASPIPGSTAIISGTTTTNLTIANVGSADAAYLYTCQVYNSAPSSTNSPLAVLSLRVSTNGNLAVPSDLISDFGETSLTSPAGLGVTNVIDGTLGTYLNYGPSASTAGPFSGPVGFIWTPLAGSTVVNALRFYAAVNASICDPADFMLEGSNDGGTNWTTIVPDEPLALPAERNFSTAFAVNVTNQVLQEVDFANSTPFTTYRVTINNVRSNSVANSMQIAEVQFLGVQQPVAPGIVVQPTPASKTLLKGGTYATTGLQASGPSPYFYQWFSVVGTTTNGIANATNAGLTLNNVQLSQSGNYFCVVSNIYGATMSSLLSLTVQLPSPGYASTIVADGPIAYWRLDEGNGNPPTAASPNGYLVANDYMGQHSGFYTNATIGVTPGYSTNDTDTAAGFGPFSGSGSQDSFVGQVPAFTNFVAASNQPAAFSVEAWVQNPSAAAQSIAGAGIVTYGYGGGGEQFALDCGGTSNNFRFYFRDAAGTSHPINAPSSGTGDGLWHHVVGVLNSQNASNNADYIYVDGQLVGSLQLGTNLLGVRSGGSPLSIGARSTASTTNMNDQFNGYIDEVAIYPIALSSNQVAAHYYASGIAPYFTLQPTNTTVSQDGNTMFVANVVGTPALSLQWYKIPASGGGAVTNLLAHQTNATLVLTDVQPDLSGPDSYFLLASNSYGVNASALVTLTVVSGPPVFLQDLQPNYTFLAGYPFSLATIVGGTPPITFGWYYNTSTGLQDGSRISGSHSNELTIANAQLSDTGTYQLIATNANGTTASQLATVTIVPTVGFNGFGSSWAANGSANYSGSNVLTLTTGTGQNASSFFSDPVYIGAFEASWTYQDVNIAGADGACFVIQNAPAGIAALGGAGGGLGVTGITPSAELEFNIYSGNAYGGVGYALTTNGAVVNVTDPYPVDIASGDPIFVKLTYINGIANLTIVDTNIVGGYYNTSMAINLPASVGGTTAYVGFTGATGGTGSYQTISDFNIISWPALTAQSAGAGSIVLSWPSGVGAYVLEQSTSLNPPSWTSVGGTVTQVGGMNQQTVLSSAGQTFYRLHLTYTPQ